VAAFPLGCPTDGVKAPEEEEPKWKGLSRLEQLRLLNAAQTLRVRKARGTHQGLRDHALVATLLGTGLRVSELLAIDVAQYHERGFVNVLRKGGHVKKFLPIQKQHRKVLDEWLAQRGVGEGPIFRTRSGKRLDRTQAFLILQRLAGRPTPISPQSSTSKCHPMCYGIRYSGRWRMRKASTMPWSSRGIGAIATSGATSSRMSKASPTPSMA
jgi:site-specific recombinase XerC